MFRPNQQTHCTECGSPVAAESSFCGSCGASRREAVTVPSQGSLERITTDRLTEATTGEFEILERVGHGAMGSVYLARDVALSRRVAIKVISPQLLQDESMVARFRLEAQTVAALQHPNIVNIYAVREIGDLHFFIMDFVDGPSLSSLIKAHGPLDIGVTQVLLFQIGSALSYAHRRGRGVIHRDVKPANIMVDREGKPVVMDFGISKVGASQSGLTQTGTTIGTPEYMSPEQCMDKELSGASDQYALGIVAYEMLTGAVPYKGSTYAIMMAHAEGTPSPIGGQRPDCPKDVEAAVSRMLAKSPAERFSDVEEAMAALGGRPLGYGDPVRDAIVALVDSVSSEAAGLDESSPLSPVPKSRGPEDVPAAASVGDAPVIDEVEGVSRSAQIKVEESRAAVAVSPPDPVGSPERRKVGGRVWLGVAALIAVAFGLSQVVRAGGTPEVANDVTVSQPTVVDSLSAGDTVGSTGESAAENPGAGQDVASRPPTQDARPPEVVAPPSTPAVTAVRIEGGDRVLGVGGRTPISATALTGDGATLDDVTVEWNSSDDDVAAVRGDQLVGGDAGNAMITATVDGVVGEVGIRIIALPSREEVAVLLQERFLDQLGRRDTGAIQRLLGRDQGTQLQREIVQRMQEPSFSAQMTRLGDVTPSGPGVTMDFDVGMRWREASGARVPPRSVSFRAMLGPTPNGWRLAGVRRLPPS